MLAPDLDSRIAAGETMNLIEMKVSYDSRVDMSNLSLLVTRAADDIPADEGIYAGKGAIGCADGWIVVLAMGPSAELRGPCSGALPAVTDDPPEAIICGDTA
jgi:hypothetical protein